MDVMLPISDLSKAQRRDNDRLVAARSRESVEATIMGAQRRQPTNLETARPRRPSYKSVGIGNKCSGHHKLMDPHPWMCLRIYGLGNARELTSG